VLASSLGGTVGAQSDGEGTSTAGMAASAHDGLEGLTRDEAEALALQLELEKRQVLAGRLSAAFDRGEVQHDGRVLAFLSRQFGSAPEGERSLWISLHGGGGAPAEVNDQQWRNQLGLYEPEEGFYVAPRAPTNTWNLWHEGPVDALLDQLIAAFVSLRGVDPDRVYLLGYSAGGDGVYQLAPRMADRFAAAAAMAGHPNEARPLGLRNLPIALFVGGQDEAYGRAAATAAWSAELDALRTADPDAYVHRLDIYPACGHWMDGQDKVALPWMATHRRQPWPRRIVWFQDDVVHTRFYWLSLPAEEAEAGGTLVAEVSGQLIQLEAPGVQRLRLLLGDALLDLDQEIRVMLDGAEVYAGRVPRTRAAIERSLSGSDDAWSVATAALDIQRPGG